MSMSGCEAKPLSQIESVEIEDVEVTVGPKMSYAEAVKLKTQPDLRKKKKVQQAEVSAVTLKRIKADNSIKPLERIQVLLATQSGKQIEAAALPDTGANINVMPEEIARQFYKSIRKPATILQPKCANNTGMKITGMISTDLIYKETLVADVEWQISPGAGLILGKQLVKQLELISGGFPRASARAKRTSHSAKKKHEEFWKANPRFCQMICQSKKIQKST